MVLVLKLLVRRRLAGFKGTLAQQVHAPLASTFGVHVI